VNLARATFEKASLPSYEELAEFFGELRLAGYRLDPRQVAAAEWVVEGARRAEVKPETMRLKTLLAPVLVTSDSQQSDFYQRFEAWANRRTTPIPEASQFPKSSEELGDRKRLRI
jgi:hypothetical protein